MGLGTLIAAAATILVGIGAYTRLAALQNRVRNARSQIEAQLERRRDLIPGLVETANAFLAHERGVLKCVVEARRQAMDARGIPEQAEAENHLTQALGRLFAVAEACPELKTDRKLLALWEELTETESEIAVARQYYNDQVMAFNSKIHEFPRSLIAGVGRFHPAEYFIIDEPAPRQTPGGVMPAQAPGRE